MNLDPTYADNKSIVLPYALESKIQNLESYNMLYGDVYRTATEIFKGSQLLREVTLEISSNDSLMVGGIGKNQYGEDIPIIHLGEKGELAQTVKNRLIFRLGLDAERYATAPDEVLRSFALAHEIGHIIQAEPTFTYLFGNTDSHTYIPEDDYRSYVNSDNELNADYIARLIMGHSRLNAQFDLGVVPPKQPPQQWREWARDYRI